MFQFRILCFKCDKLIAIKRILQALQVVRYHFISHDINKILVVDDPPLVAVDLINDFSDFLLFRLEAECAHGNLELFRVDLPGPLRVEQVERFFDFLLLFFSQLLSSGAFAFYRGLALLSVLLHLYSAYYILFYIKLLFKMIFIFF